MAALSGKKIRERLEDADLQRRLVISPLLLPDEQLRDDQASIDVRLGFEFALVSPSAYGSIDEFSPRQEDRTFSKLYRIKYVSFGETIVIHPHQFILATTLEYLRLPSDLVSYVAGRSTWGRLGLIVATAVGIHPGFAGSLTLELRNLGETPLSLYPGQAIAQLFLHEVKATDLTVAGLGQYSGSVSMIPRNISSAATRVKIASIRMQRLSP